MPEGKEFIEPLCALYLSPNHWCEQGETALAVGSVLRRLSCATQFAAGLGVCLMLPVLFLLECPEPLWSQQ